MPAEGTGKRQRLDACQHVCNLLGLFEDKMSSSLIEAWCACELSSVKVQSWANQTYLALKSVLQSLGHGTKHIPPPIVALASMGNWGRVTGNVRRDLVAYLGQPKNQPSPCFAEMQVKIQRPFPRLADVMLPFFLISRSMICIRRIELSFSILCLIMRSIV